MNSLTTLPHKQSVQFDGWYVKTCQHKKIIDTRKCQDF